MSVETPPLSPWQHHGPPAEMPSLSPWQHLPPLPNESRGYGRQIIFFVLQLQQEVQILERHPDKTFRKPLEFLPTTSGCCQLLIGTYSIWPHYDNNFPKMAVSIQQEGTKNIRTLQQKNHLIFSRITEVQRLQEAPPLPRMSTSS